MIESFEESGLNPEILKAIEKMGFIAPTPIQAQTLPFILNEEHDLIAQAQTGTGKTAAFGLPLIHLAEKKSTSVQILVLCPTRELCMQITSDFEKFTEFTPEFKVAAIYGGANIESQIKAVKQGVHAIIGTPGRTLDLIRRKALKVGNIKWLVLDEADEMLNMGFKDELDAILEETPKLKRTFLFSATMPNEIVQMAKNYMSDSERIAIGKQNAAAENVKHEYYMVHARDRFEVLRRIADLHPNIYCIVFCRTRTETKEVADKLMQGGYNADALHGDLSQPQRSYVMNRFRLHQLQILVATDVAARGLDVESLTHVINYNLPDDLEVYIHRSGRTGRAGNKGTAITIVHTRENKRIRDLEKMANIKFERKMVPNGHEICQNQLFNLIDKIEKVEVDEDQISQFLPSVYKKLEWLPREELIKHVVSVEFNHFLTYYKEAPDLNVEESKEREPRKKDRPERQRGGEQRSRDSRGGEQRSREPRSEDQRSRGTRDNDQRSRGPRSGGKEFTRFYINLGSKKGLEPMGLIGLINETTRNRNIAIGKIDILRKFSFFEIDSRFKEEVKEAFKNLNAISPDIVIDESKPDTFGEKKENFGERKENFGGKSDKFRDKKKKTGRRPF